VSITKQLISYLVLILGFSINPAKISAQHLRLDFRPALSIPLGDFGANTLNGGSFAMAGFSGSLALHMPIKSAWSVKLQAAFARHSIDVSALGYEKVKQDPFLEDLYIRSEAFSNNMLMAGPVFELKLTERFFLESNLLAGIAQSKTPYQLYKPSYFLTGPPFFEITSATAYSFAWGASAALLADFGSCYSLGLSAEWLHTNPVFGFSTKSGFREDKLGVSLLNIGLVFNVKLF